MHRAMTSSSSMLGKALFASSWVLSLEQPCRSRISAPGAVVVLKNKITEVRTYLTHVDCPHRQRAQLKACARLFARIGAQRSALKGLRCHARHCGLATRSVTRG